MAVSPIRPTDDAARALAQEILQSAKTAALGVIEAGTQMPMVTRVSVYFDSQTAAPVSLISSLSAHTKALRTAPQASLLLGEPGPNGDPLNTPRLTLQCKASFIDRQSEAHTEMRQQYVLAHPKSKLYIDFADFSFVRFDVIRAYLNGGFGKAFHLSPKDLQA